MTKNFHYENIFLTDDFLDKIFMTWVYEESREDCFKKIELNWEIQMKWNEMKCLYSPPTLMIYFNFFNIEFLYYNIPPKKWILDPIFIHWKMILSFIEVILVAIQKSLSTFFFTSDPLRNYLFLKISFHFRPNYNLCKKNISTLDPTLISTKK